MANTNPTCYQFVSAFKTSLLNGLVAPKSRGSNTESGDKVDEGVILDDLTKLMENCLKRPEENREYLQNVFYNIPDAPTNLNMEEKQAASYVAGYVAEKTMDKNCMGCRRDILSPDILEDHIFTMFRENDDNIQALTYVNTKFMLSMVHARNIAYKIFEEYGSDINVMDDLQKCLAVSVNFDYLTCEIHSSVVMINKIVKVISELLFRKFYGEYQIRLEKSRYGRYRN